MSEPIVYLEGRKGREESIVVDCDDCSRHFTPEEGLALASDLLNCVVASTLIKLPPPSASVVGSGDGALYEDLSLTRSKPSDPRYDRPCPACGIRIGDHSADAAPFCLGRLGLRRDKPTTADLSNPNVRKESVPEPSNDPFEYDPHDGSIIGPSESVEISSGGPEAARGRASGPSDDDGEVFIRPCIYDEPHRPHEIFEGDEWCPGVAGVPDASPDPQFSKSVITRLITEEMGTAHNAPYAAQRVIDFLKQAGVSSNSARHEAVQE